MFVLLTGQLAFKAALCIGASLDPEGRQRIFDEKNARGRPARSFEVCTKYIRRTLQGCTARNVYRHMPVPRTSAAMTAFTPMSVVLLNKKADENRKAAAVEPVSEKKGCKSWGLFFFFGAPPFVLLVTTRFTIYMRIIYKL